MDSQADFDRKTRAMFDRATEFLEEVAFQYVVQIGERLMERTPGFENQKPGTEYIPTGRLRGGYSYSVSALATASRWEGGPYSDYGKEPLAEIVSSMRARGVKSFYIVNDVAYGYIVRWGLNQHADVGPRDWPGQVADITTQRNALNEALSIVRRP